MVDTPNGHDYHPASVIYAAIIDEKLHWKEYSSPEYEHRNIVSTHSPSQVGNQMGNLTERRMQLSISRPRISNTIFGFRVFYSAATSATLVKTLSSSRQWLALAWLITFRQTLYVDLIGFLIPRKQRTRKILSNAMTSSRGYGKWQPPTPRQLEVARMTAKRGTIPPQTARTMIITEGTTLKTMERTILYWKHHRLPNGNKSDQLRHPQ